MIAKLTFAQNKPYSGPCAAIQFGLCEPVILFCPQSAYHILVFDSGVGGLSVSREIRRVLPDLNQTYLADDAFRPYGAKTEAQLRARLSGLLAPVCAMLSPDIVIIACNTASTTALPAIRAVLDIPVVGVVPAIKPAVAISKTKTIAVLGTPGTVRRTYVDALIDRYASECEVQLRGSVALVEEAERKFRDLPIDMARIRAEIAPIFDGRSGGDIDAIVLACTHFPLLREELQAAADQPLTLVDSGEAVARRVKSLLSAKPDMLGRPLIHETAFLIGPDTDPARRAAFYDYGFDRIINLPDV